MVHPKTAGNWSGVKTPCKCTFLQLQLLFFMFSEKLDVDHLGRSPRLGTGQKV